MNKGARGLIFLLAICCTLFYGCRRLTPAEKVKKGEEQLGKGDVLEAIITFQDVVKKYPEDPAVYDAYLGLASCYFRQKDLEGAKDYLNKVIEKLDFKDQRGIFAFDNKLTLYFGQRKFKEAIQESEHALKELDPLNPYYVRLQLRLADFYFNNAQTTSSETLLKTIIKEDLKEANRLSAMDLLVHHYNREQKFQAALQTYQDYLTDNPDSEFATQVKVGVAFYYDRLEEKAKAEQLYNEAFQEYNQKIEAAEEEPKKAQLMFQLARAYALKGSYDQARAQFKAVMERFPTIRRLAEEAILNIGDLFVEEGKYDDAISYFQNVMAKHRGQRLAFLAQRRISDINKLRVSAGVTSPPLTRVGPTTPTAEINQ